MLTCHSATHVTLELSQLPNLVVVVNQVSDPPHYCSLTVELQYLTFTPYISFVVHQVCLYMQDSRQPHLQELKHTIRYIWGTLDHDL